MVLLAAFALALPAAADDDETDESSEAASEYPLVVDGEAVFDRPVAARVVPAFQIVVDIPYLMSTRTAIAGAGTVFEGTPAIRVGALFPAPEEANAFVPFGMPLLVGFDVAAGGNFSGSGTLEINGVSTLGIVEARGLAAVDFGWPVFNLLPYAFVGGVTGAGIKSVTALGVVRSYPDFVLGVRSGVGAIAKISVLTLRVDSGVGVRNARLEVTTNIALGLMF